MTWVLAVYVAGQLTWVGYHTTYDLCVDAGERMTRGIERATYSCTPNQKYRPR